MAGQELLFMVVFIALPFLCGVLVGHALRRPEVRIENHFLVDGDLYHDCDEEDGEDDEDEDDPPLALPFECDDGDWWKRGEEPPF